MYFTQDDYIKIEEWLSHRTVKDSEFPEADPLDGTETFLILQDKKNKVIKLKDFINQDSEMGVYGIYNVSALHNAYGISREEAIALVPEEKRKRGLIISYRTKDITSGQVVTRGGWAIEQFIGETLDDWNKESWWEDIVLRWFNKFVGQANGIAPLDENGLVPLVNLPSIGEVYNASAELNNYNLSKFEAIDSVPDFRKKLGLIITFCSKPGNWDILQFQGTSLDLWKSYGYWKNIHQEVLNLMGQPNGIATLNSDGKIDYADLEDIPKSKVGLGNVTNDAQVKRSEMGVANGVATLNESGIIPSTQLPSYVDDVLEYDNFNSLPTPGETGKIYVTIDTNLTYRWAGSQYTEISKSLALGETSSTAYAGNRGKENREALDSLPNNIVYSVKDFTSTNNSVTFNYGFNTKGANNKYGNSTNATKTIAAATTENAGVMSAADKAKLIGIEEGAQINSIISVAGKTGQVLLNKNDVGLSAVDNTSDEDKPLSSAARVANTNLLTKINQKLPKENVIRCSDLNNIENPYNGEFVYCDQESKFYVYSNDYGWQALIDSTALTRYTYSSGQIDNKITTVGNSINNKVDKVSGKQLSTNDFNNTYKDILDNPWAPPISISGGGGAN